MSGAPEQQGREAAPELISEESCLRFLAKVLVSLAPFEAEDF